MVEYTRCARCRNPIRAHQRCVPAPSGNGSFHDDCWAVTQAEAQREYVDRANDEGPLALLSAYVVRLGEGSPLRARYELAQAAVAAAADDPDDPDACEDAKVSATPGSAA